MTHSGSTLAGMGRVLRVFLAPLIAVFAALGALAPPAGALPVDSCDRAEPSVLLLDTGKQRALWRSLSKRYRVYGVPSHWNDKGHRLRQVLSAIDEERVIVVARDRRQLSALAQGMGRQKIAGGVVAARSLEEVEASLAAEMARGRGLSLDTGRELYRLEQ